VSETQKNTSSNSTADVPVSSKEKELYKILVEEVTQDVLKKIRSQTIDSEQVEKDSLQEDDAEDALDHSFEGQLDFIESISPHETRNNENKEREVAFTGVSMEKSTEPRSIRVASPSNEKKGPHVHALGPSNPSSRRNSAPKLVPPPPLLLHMDSVQPAETYADDLRSELDDLEKDIRMTLGSIEKLKAEIM
jgi:hypothetical protein